MGRGRNWLVAGVAGLVALVGALTFLTDAVADSRELLSGVTEAPGIKVVRGRVGGPAETPYGVRGGAPLSRRIEVLVDAGRAAEVEAVVRGLGGVVVASSPSVVLVEVSLSSLDDLVAIAGVERIREPVVVDLPPAPDVTFEDGLTGGQLPSAVDADAWHAEGHTGHGVRIGVIDGFDGTTWTMAQDAGSVPVPAGTFCMFIGSTCDVWLGGTAHGVAVAEGIHSIAPGSSLYLASVGTVTDYYAAIDWFAAQGVTIVSRSLGSLLDGPGDGSGPMDAVADYAVSQGMVWFNSAGNHAARSGGDGQYWRGPWVDGDSDGWIEFAPDDELMGMWCDSQIQGFRWSDWSGNATDYDVYLFSGDGMDLLAGSERDQTAGATPLELLSGHAIDCDANPVLQVGVHLHDAGNGTSGDVLEMMVNLGGLEHAQDAYSASGPVSDSSNPAVMSVGALDPGDGITIAPYSSQGPTNDGRVKPDVAAPACYPTTAYPDYCFAGTSAAAPVAAGSAALVRGAGVASTPTAIASYLRTHALDRGAPGVDHVYGHGQLHLGEPPKTLDAEAHQIMLVDPGQGEWHVYDETGVQQDHFYFGNPADYPILGDWDCDGVETPGMYRQSDGYVYLRNSNDQGNAQIRFFFGNPGDVPVAGDFDGDGCDTVSIYRPSEARFYIIDALGENDGGLGAAETSYVFGNPGDKPFVGDFDGDGVETVGLHREATGLVYFRNTHTQGNAHAQFIFGDPGDRIIAGDWNGDGTFSPGLYRPSNTTAYFRFTNTQGNADAQFVPKPASSGWLPVSGSRG